MTDIWHKNQQKYLLQKKALSDYEKNVLHVAKNMKEIIKELQTWYLVHYMAKPLNSIAKHQGQLVYMYTWHIQW